MPSSKNSVIQFWVFILFGGMVGLFVSTILNLPYRWMIVILLAMCLPFIGFIAGDLRRFFLLLLILSIPLSIDINFYQKFEFQAGAHTAGIALRDVFVLLLLAVWVIEKTTSEELRTKYFPRLTVPALVYLELCLMSLIWAPKVDLAALEVIQMAKVFVLYFILANNLRSVNDIRFVAWALLATVAFEGAVTIAQMATGRPLGIGFLGETQVRVSHGMRYARVGGTLGHPNELAMYLELVLPLCAGIFVSAQRQRDRFFAAGGFGLGLIALVMTGSRGAWIGFFFSMALFVYIILKRKLIEFKKIVIPIVLVFLIMCIVTVSFWATLERRFTGDDHGSAIGRIPLIQVALRVIKAYPIGGVGLNNYAVVMKDYDNTIMGRMFTSLQRPVHNMYLLITAETGILGFAGFIWFLVAILLTAQKAVRRSDFRLSLVGVGLLSGFVAFMIHGLVDKHPPGGYPLFYTLMALTVSTANIKDNVIIQPPLEF